MNPNQVSKLVTFPRISLLACTLFSASHAATIDVTNTWQNVAPAIVSSLNTGGLDTDVSDLFADGSPELSFAVTIDDSADTGSIYSAVLTFAGVTNNSVAQVSTNPAGRVVFATQPTRQSTLTMSVGSIAQVSGPATTTIIFDGFKSIELDQFTVANDSFVFDGNSYDGATNGGTSVTFDALAPSGSTIERTDIGQFRPGGLTMTFTVAQIPEPSSALLALFGMSGILIRRR